MKEHRNDASRASADSANEHTGRRHQGDNAHLSARDRAGRRVSQLDSQQREGVADEALEDASGAVPYRDEMEQRFGRSFGDVRVADGARNREALDEIGADGVARDNTIAFRDESPSREAVAHELTHVAQAGASTTGSRQDAEREAFGAEQGHGAIEVSAGVGAGVAHFRDSADSGMASMPALPAHFPGPMAGDEKFPVDWRQVQQAFSDPFKLVDCTVKRDAPPDPDISKPKADGRCHPGHHQQRGPLDLDHGHLGNFRRDQYWSAFTTASIEAQSEHEKLGGDVEIFRHAEQDNQLRALGFVLGKSGSIDVASLADAQQVPQRGGPTVGSLFDGNQALKLGRRDQQAIDQSGQAMEHGKGSIEATMLKTIGADNDVKAGILKVKAAANNIKSVTHEQQRIVHAIKFEEHRGDAAAAQDEIDQLKAEVAKAKDFFNAVVSLTAGIVFSAGGDLGDAISQIGVVGSIVLDHANDAKIASATNKLNAADVPPSATPRVMSEFAFSHTRSG